MTRVRNISDGPRGGWKGGELVMAEKGHVIDVDDFAPEWFEAVGPVAAKRPSPPDRDRKDGPGGSLPTNVQKLKGIAKDEGVALGDAKKAADIQALILSARAAKAAAVEPPALADMGRDELIALAEAEEVEIEEGSSDADIIAAIELKREAAAE